MVIVLVLFLASQSLLAQQPLAITRVLLYKNGMAYIVRSGPFYDERMLELA